MKQFASGDVLILKVHMILENSFVIFHSLIKNGWRQRESKSFHFNFLIGHRNVNIN